MALTVSARSRRGGPSTPALIRGSALCAAAGVGLSITDYADFGKWLTVIGVVAMVIALHRFGRSGPDEPIRFQLAPLQKKKKRKKSARVAREPSTDGESSDGL